MEKAFDEELTEFLKKKLEKELKEQEKYKFYSNTGDICDDIIIALELCDKILTYNYFKDSENILDNCSKEIPKVYKKWNTLYNKELKEKKKDLKKLVSIVVNNCEDWC